MALSTSPGGSPSHHTTNSVHRARQHRTGVSRARFFGLVINLSYRDGITTGTNPNLGPDSRPRPTLADMRKRYQDLGLTPPAIEGDFAEVKDDAGTEC